MTDINPYDAVKPVERRPVMTATDLLHHVFDWEVATGIARVDDDSITAPPTAVAAES